jgi:Ca-activated chloride channel homolog
MKLELNFDEQGLHEFEPTVRHLIARLTPPATSGGGELPPLDLALVIDASGSMSGLPLEAAKQAAVGVARGLSTVDRLTVVSFADDVVIHTESLGMDGAGLERALSAIGTIETRGCTNLSSGWRSACELLLPDGAEEGPRRRVVVVLSDGHANRGVVEPEVLAAHSRSYLERGVTTSAVGIGDGYSTAQLAAITEHGGGHLHDVEHPEEMIEVLLGEVGSLADVTAECVDLVIEATEGAMVRVLEDFSKPATHGPLAIPVGLLRGGVSRSVVLRVEVPPGSSRCEVRGQAEWNSPGSAERRRTPHVFTEVSLAHSKSDRVGGGQQSPGLSLRDAKTVLVSWESGLVKLVTELNRSGDTRGIEQLREQESSRFLGYASRHPETRKHGDRVSHLFERSLRPIPERSRKLMYDIAQKDARSQPVHYLSPKGAWFDQMS